jgi:hypothetical protein
VGVSYAVEVFWGATYKAMYPDVTPEDNLNFRLLNKLDLWNAAVSFL